MNQSKFDRQVEAGAETFIRGVGDGIKKMIRAPNLILVFILVTLACGVIFYLRDIILGKIFPEGEFNVFTMAIHLIWLIPILTLYGFSRMEGQTTDAAEAFASIRFCNRQGQYPEQIGKDVDGKKVILSFRSPGLTITDWRSRKSELETVFDCNIVKFEIPAHTKQIIKMHIVPSSDGLSTNLLWADQCISDKEFVIIAGEDLLGPVEFNLDKYPHALIAGVTGSGKSVALRCLFWQCIRKGVKPYMIDFKGGIEFSAFESFGEVIARRQDALELLKDLNREMMMRLDLFRETGTKNLSEYNRRYPNDELARVVLVCDEIAEMLDKTGLQAADKAIFYEIEKEMSSLARLSRAAGIHMLLATQRPDAKVIVGQIKNNLPIRISGRMVDSQASEMVLGNTKAAELGDTLGRFMYSVGADTWEFQAYNFQDADIRPGNYQRGKMLLNEEKSRDSFRFEKAEEDYDEYEDLKNFEADHEYRGF
ncbi:FtsK/SpoIIIE domain-containing protein [Emergencia sp. JLR.KK010]|uniref:FtsK/SpoIIIE domain-containing protein n=1 Tax=Emergencia sp. JLR.KK010 TaxID=3114296 RepID=UPI0030D18731